MEYKPIVRPVVYAPEAVRIFGVQWYASAIHFRGRLEVRDCDTAEIIPITDPVERPAAAWRRLGYRVIRRFV